MKFNTMRVFFCALTWFASASSARADGACFGCAVPSAPPEVIVLRTEILIQKTETLKDVELRFIPSTGQLNLFRRGVAGPLRSVMQDRAHWLAALDIFVNEMDLPHEEEALDNFRIRGFFAARTAEGTAIFEGPKHELDFGDRGSPSFPGLRPLAIARDKMFWNLLTGPVPHESFTQNVLVVRRLERLKVSLRERCVLQTVIGRTWAGVDEETRAFFNAHGGGDRMLAGSDVTETLPMSECGVN